MNAFVVTLALLLWGLFCLGRNPTSRGIPSPPRAPRPREYPTEDEN